MSKIFIILLWLNCISLHVSAQVLVRKIPNEDLTGVDSELMQQGYKIAFSKMSSEDYLFKGREEEWKKCWIDLMHHLNQYMQKAGLHLNTKSTCYNRIYFNKEGLITAYLYHLSGLTEQEEQIFDRAIFQFLITQKVNINAPQNYWQYGTLRFE